MNILRWTARILSLLSVAFVLLFLFGEGFMVDGAWPTTIEWIGLLFFPFGLIFGLLIAWRNEFFGALLAAGSVIAFYGWNFMISGDWPRGPYFLLLALPALLFLIVAWWKASKGR